MSNNSISDVTGGNVVIEGADVATGAQAVEASAVGRDTGILTQHIPGKHLGDAALKLSVETFLYQQAAMLDAKDWQGFIDTFTEEGVYWMPSHFQQTSWELEPSIFAEDKFMMEIRMNRLLHSNAWSQAPMWSTNHLLGNVIVEAISDDLIEVSSRFQMMELRRDDVRHFGGTYRHQLVPTNGSYQVSLMRVDLSNGQAAYDYVLQAWV